MAPPWTDCNVVDRDHWDVSNAKGVAMENLKLPPDTTTCVPSRTVKPPLPYAQHMPSPKASNMVNTSTVPGAPQYVTNWLLTCHVSGNGPNEIVRDIGQSSG